MTTSPLQDTPPVEEHRERLEALRQETTARLEQLRAGYEELELNGDDVGAADDEGGGEADGVSVERDAIRVRIAEEGAALEAIDDALARSHTDSWATCTRCGKGIGDARLEALPTTSLCVTCKAAGVTW